MNLFSHIRDFSSKYIRAVFGSIYLLTIGQLNPVNRGKLTDLAEFFGWKNPLKSFQTIIPQINPSELFNVGLQCEIHEPVGQDGNVSLLELLILINAVKRKNPKEILEIGTFDGRTTLNLACNSDKNTKVYTLDLPDDKIMEARKNPLGDIKFVGRVESGYKYKNSEYRSKIIELKGDSATFDFSPYEKNMDFIFIDGAHSFDYVLSDTENALKMLSQNGIIFWHDYRSSCEGVTRVLNDRYKTGGIFNNLRSIKNTNLVVLLPDDMIKT